jgi:hypothetical protein
MNKEGSSDAGAELISLSNQQSNIGDKELKALKLLAAKLLAYDSRQLAIAVAAQELYEVR